MELMSHPNLDRFHFFVTRLTKLIDADPAESILLGQAKEILHDLVKQDDWLVSEFAHPHPQHYQQYLLYLDPKERFSVVSFVWGPSQATPIHDHTVWGLVGMLRGSENCQPYSRMSDGRWVPAGLELNLLAGDVEVISPKKGDVHRVWNASSSEVSISIHVYGGNIGRIERHVYEPNGIKKPFVSGYANDSQGYPFDRPRSPVLSTQNLNPLPPMGDSIKPQEPPLVKDPLSWVSKSASAQLSSNATTRQASHSSKILAGKALNVATSIPTATAVSATPLQVLSVPSLGGQSLQTQSPPSDTRTEIFIEQKFIKQAPPVSSSETRSEVTPDAQLSNHPVAVDGAVTHQLAQGVNLQHSSLPSSLGSVPQEPLSKSDDSSVEPSWVRAQFLAKAEIALLDVREEDPFAQAHPLFAANLPISRLEVDAPRRIPRRSTPIVVYDNSEGLCERAVSTLKAMGYLHVKSLRGGLNAWVQAGGELFKDVNVPSKSFGEWVCEIKKTPFVGAHQLKIWLDQNADLVVLDARRFDEYQTMSIPKGVSVPGGELVLRARSLAPNATTRIVVNCAGRTRSIIGTQSLINAGIPNPVCALENGTIGWTLAGLELEQGQVRQFEPTSAEDVSKSKLTAMALAIRSGVKKLSLDELSVLFQEADRTTYLFDVRTREEYEAGHLAQAVHAPGGQLVQETDHWAPVRGARVVLYDVEGVRAQVTASWLAQMGWETFVIKDVRLGDLQRKEPPSFDLPPLPVQPNAVEPNELKTWLSNRTNLTLVIDLGMSADYVKKHIAGAWWLLRSRMEQDFSKVHRANRYVLTCADGLSAKYAVDDLKKMLKANVEVYYLKGGNQAWFNAGHASQQGESYLASPRIDRYRRPYEGTQNSAQAMQAYLDWEFGLVEQLKRDGTHGFKVV
jgi:predicted metal-dependent enzyme (double-stranded beta helix superfamily)/rhodanese-related sulfurtransferase